MSGNLQEVSLKRSASASALAPPETSEGHSLEQVNANMGPESSDCATRLLPPQPQLNAPSTQLDKGEDSPLLTHYTCAASQSPLPDLLEALQKETEFASQQKLQQYQQQQQASEFVPEDDWSADHYSSDEEYHSGLEDGDGIEDFTRSSLNMNMHLKANANTSSGTREGRNRTPADQVEHPLRTSSYNNNSNKEVLDPSLSHADEPFFGLNHDLRNTLVTPSPPTSIRSTPTLDGSTSSNTTSSTLQQQHPSSATAAAIPTTTITQNHHRRRHRSSSTSESSSTTLRRTRAGSSSNSRLAQQQQQEEQQQHPQQQYQHEGPQDLHGQENSSLGLRASLDSGMAALRRWIRTRSTPSSSNHPNQQSLQQYQSRSSRSVSWQSDTGTDLLSPTSVGASASASAASLGDEDLFYLTMNGDDPRSPPGQQQQQQLYHPTIFEEDEDEEDVGRPRALSEPDALSFRNFLFQRALGVQSRNMRRRRGHRDRAESEGTRDVSSSMSQGRAPHLSPSAAAALYSPSAARLPEEPVDFTSLRFTGSAPVASARELSTTDVGGGGLEISTAPENSMAGPADPTRVNVSSESVDADSEIDPERQARIRWIQINRRFQLVITIVALLFSLLLFAILICWVVLTSAYVVSFDKPCDVPLKPYFWLVTLQLVLDVFRSDIMRFIFHWDPGSNQRIPCRVIAYNVAYLVYALLVLRLGIRSVFLDDSSTCQDTAKELFNSSAVFVSLSLTAWTTILCGYLLPFCVVAALLTYNGYNPSIQINQEEDGAAHAVYPAAYSTTGAPAGCIDQMQLLRMEDFPDDYPRECCICMEDFNQQHDIVETACKHVFHKQCCREWLRTARTCPVCRTDIPGTLEELPEDSEGSGIHPPRIPIGPTGRPVAGLLRILRRGESSSSVMSNNRTQRVPESPSVVSVHLNVP
jgi:hypothetical protein